ncbi:MAG: hypothetical protein AAF299_05720 [Pseudomonadota bacterium]
MWLKVNLNPGEQLYSVLHTSRRSILPNSFTRHFVPRDILFSEQLYSVLRTSRRSGLSDQRTSLPDAACITII